MHVEHVVGVAGLAEHDPPPLVEGGDLRQFGDPRGERRAHARDVGDRVVAEIGGDALADRGVQIGPAAVVVDAGRAVVAALVAAELDVAHAQRIDHRKQHEARAQFAGRVGGFEQCQQVMQDQDAGLLVGVQRGLQVNFFGRVFRPDAKVIEFGRAPRRIAREQLHDALDAHAMIAPPSTSTIVPVT